MSREIPLKTSEVAKALGVPTWRLQSLVRWERIPPPARDGSGDWVWWPEDMERARLALRRRAVALE
jgi:hypothetical protein